MSTRIYNGLKFKSKDYKEVLDQLLSIKRDAISLGNNSITEENLSLFITSNKLQDMSSFDIINLLKEYINSDCKHKYPFIPSFNFCVYLYPTKEGDIYGYYFNEITKYSKLLEDFTEDFSYYNGTDGPDEIDYADWEWRGLKWDELVPDTFKDSGFKFDIVSSTDLDRYIVQPKINSILEYIKRDIKIDEILSDIK